MAIEVAKKKETQGLIVGRFQPFHNGHIKLIQYALSKVDVLHVVIGSPNRNDEKNPYSAQLRETMIEKSLTKEELKRIRISYVEDMNNDSLWLENLASKFADCELIFSSDEKMSQLYKTNEKLKEKVVTIPQDQREDLSGTNIRNLLRDGKDISNLIPKGTLEVINQVKLPKNPKNKDIT